MTAEKVQFSSLKEACEALDSIGSDNSRFMATRAVHINVLVRAVPGAEARLLKALYNDVGGEAAISREAYRQAEGAFTDMVVMGTVYQHREVRRVLAADPRIRPWIDAILSVVDNAAEVQNS
jgi:hypothetical protein